MKVFIGFRYRTHKTPPHCYREVTRIEERNGVTFATVETFHPNGMHPSSNMPLRVLEDYLSRPNIGLTTLTPY